MVQQVRSPIDGFGQQAIKITPVSSELDPYNITEVKDFVRSFLPIERLAHVQAVAQQVEQTLSRTPSLEHYQEKGVCAAWLHDIGYAPELFRLGFHPLDGAFFLKDLGAHDLAEYIVCHSHAPEYARLACLPQIAVSHHPIALVLSYWDNRTGPDGTIMSYKERIAEISKRHGKESLVMQAHRKAESRLQEQTLMLKKVADIEGLQ